MKTNLTHILAALALSAASLTPAFAQQAPAPSAAPGASASADLTEGEVRKVDKEQKKITIKHGEIKNLDMPAMTMVFAVSDPAMVDQVKAGDKIRFRATDQQGKLTVTELQASK